MGSPVPPNIPVLLVALRELSRAAWSGRLPDVLPGAPFWAAQRDAGWLLSSGYARAWAPGDPAAPPAESRWTAHGSPGLGAGTSNCSH